MLRRAIFSQLKTLAPRRPTADALGSLPLISARLSATRCYRPRGRQGADRRNEEEEPYGNKGLRGAGRYTKDEEIPEDESDGSETESEEEEEPMLSEKQLAKLRVGKHEQILPSHTGKVALPKTISKYTVLRSPHVHKKSREQFETRVHRQLLFIRAEPHELEKKFFWLKRQCIFGAQHEVVVSYQTRLGDVKKIINSPSSKEKPKAI